MMRFSKKAGLLVAPLFFTTFTGCYAQNGDTGAANETLQQQRPAAGLLQVPLTVQSGETVHEFIVELAQTDEEQAKGLMFRKELAPNKGMVFPFSEDKMAGFWMKNTVISLDIIFIRRDGTIESIAANTTPYSLDSVRSNEPVAAVLEIAAGRAAELSIVAGDKIAWKN